MYDFKFHMKVIEYVSLILFLIFFTQILFLKFIMLQPESIVIYF